MVTGDSWLSGTSSQCGRMVKMPQEPRYLSDKVLNVAWSDRTEGDDRQRRQSGRRKAHNVVERRYRVNLNSKFRRLQELVWKPNLLLALPEGLIPPTDRDSIKARRVEGASSPKKALSKADILDISMKYIQSLEDEIYVLRDRLGVIEASSQRSI
jgi:cation transport regulator ChaB